MTTLYNFIKTHRYHKDLKIYLILPLLILKNITTFAQHDSIPKTAAPLKGSYYVEAGSYGTKRESQPPSYTRNFGHVINKENLEWLIAGLDYRARFEYRENDIRRPVLTTDYPLLLRNRAYLGVVNLLDPFRFTVEYEDARRVNSSFPEDTRDFNRNELIQAYGELYFDKVLPKDPRGNERPVFLRFGRQAFEFLDRRLIATNEWRNTTNNFLGLRAAIGQDKNNWHIDLLALRPILRLESQFDKTDHDRNFWAAIGHWRGWSRYVTIEPYYLGLWQQATVATASRARMVHSPGVRVYGWLDGHINYDFSYTQQFGEEGGQQVEAYMVTSEAGYKITEHSWKPRFSLFYGYVSGDKNPNDNITNRFERFYGFARPWSSDDYIVPENIVTSKAKVEFEPMKGVRIDGGYSFYWLASANDRLTNLLGGANNRDRDGNSGKFVGHGLDMRARFKPVRFIYANIGYTHFTNGDFVLNRQKAALEKSSPASDFAYLELVINVFNIPQP